MPLGHGQKMSSATMTALKDWNISSEKIVALCFDTTSSNTRIHVGACTLLEKQLGKTLLYTACRHHIHEVILSHVYKTCFGASSGPEIKLFGWCIAAISFFFQQCLPSHSLYSHVY